MTTWPHLDVLMYHSISQGSGPTCIAPETFRLQMQVLEECGYRTVSLADLAGWLRGEKELPPRSVVLTFDDGFEDFASHAFEELARRRWSATVFLPTGKVGQPADWDHHCLGRRILSWDMVIDLARRGIDFGGHGVNHCDLTRLTPERVRREIEEPKLQIAERTGREIISFAAPFGKTTPSIRADLQRVYTLAVGTTLAHVTKQSDGYNLPRIEMWYFRSPQRWRAYLQGKAQGYFALRQLLRRARGFFQAG